MAVIQPHEVGLIFVCPLCSNECRALVTIKQVGLLPKSVELEATNFRMIIDDHKPTCEYLLARTVVQP